MAPRTLNGAVAEPMKLRRRLRRAIRCHETNVEWLSWLVTTKLTGIHKTDVEGSLAASRKALVELRAALTEAGGESDV